MVKADDLYGIHCIVHMHDEHVDDVLLHTCTHIHKYRQFSHMYDSCGACFGSPQ